ncbi:MAG: zinc ribbon domain-containing protein [Acidobacteriota bacterium]|nr:zinc ribbon domain-containing protein [Acidobacteriota bacterium]
MFYCPKCGTQNVEGASFCRACGANLSLVPQAFTGQLPQPPTAFNGLPEGSRRARRRRREERPASLDKAIRTFFMGVAFIFVALAAKTYAPAGAVWWFWMLIPAFAMIGGGLSEYARYKQGRQQPPLQPPTYTPPPAVGAAQQHELPPRPARDIYAPPASVTENTTQLLDRER